MNNRTFSSSQAHRLDSAERKQWLPINDVIEKLVLHPGLRIADIGAGTGYFALPMAEAVGTSGTVFAVDIQPEMLIFIEEKLKTAGVENVRCSVGEAGRTGLPDGSCDLILMSYLWHELDDLDDVLTESKRILVQGGRVAIVDWRPGVQQPPGPPLEHRVPAQQVEASLVRSGFKVTCSEDMGPFGYVVIANI